MQYCCIKNNRQLPFRQNLRKTKQYSYYSTITGFELFAISDNEWNNTAKAMEFLMVIGEYLADCGLMMPNPEEYKEVRDSGRLINE